MGSFCVAWLARCVKYVMYCCDGYLTKAMKWNRFFWFMGQGDIVTGGHDGELGTDGHTLSTVRKGEVNAGTQLLSPVSLSPDPSPWIVLPIFGVFSYLS